MTDVAHDLESGLKDVYDYDAIIAGAPTPESTKWVFGYGSILFKPGFTSPDDHVFGAVHGWKRVFYQNSTDHRGTPEFPGRTVTLLPEASEETWGVAIRLPEDLEERRRALQDLEWREKQYDLKVYTDVYGHDGTVLVENALMYVGSSDPATNLNWGGAKSQQELAEQIFRSSGPSGPNCEYLFGIAEGLRAIGEHAHDDHVFELEKLVRAMQNRAAGEAENGATRRQ